MIEFLQVQIPRLPDKEQRHHCDRGIDAIDNGHAVPIVKWHPDRSVPLKASGAIMPPITAEMLYEMPVPEYLNFVGKLSEVRIGASPCNIPTPKKVISSCGDDAPCNVLGQNRHAPADTR